MIYGDPQIQIVDDQTDRIGIRTLILSKLWQPVRWPVPLEELDSEKPEVPEVPGGLAFIGEQTRRAGGALRTFWTFEGIAGDGKNVTFKDRKNSPDYSFEAGFAQVSIIKHPKWPSFKKTYGGTVLDGQVFFPEVVPNSSGFDGRLVDEVGGTTNPLFGHTDFYRMEGTYSFRYASKTYDLALVGVGTIADPLPGTPPPVKDGRDWLKAPPNVIHRGVIYDITEVYWLSGAGGWPKPIYTP